MIRRPPRSPARPHTALPWSARCYGVARHREGSRQNSIGGSGVLSLRHFGSDVLTPELQAHVGIVCRLLFVYWLRPARCCSTGSGRVGGAAAAGRTMQSSLAAPSPI